MGTLAFACRYLEGGKSTFYRLAKAASATNEEVQKFVDFVESQPPSYQHTLPLDRMAEFAGVSPRLLIEAVAGEAFEQGYSVARLLAGHEFPAVVQSSIKAAKNPLGTKDREMLMLHAGFVPAPRGSVVNIQQNVVQNTNQQGMETFEDTMSKIHGSIRRVKRLPERNPVEEIVEADVLPPNGPSPDSSGV
jgi:hypothetical protein